MNKRKANMEELLKNYFMEEEESSSEDNNPEDNYMGYQNIKSILSGAEWLVDNVQEGQKLDDWIEDKLSVARVSLSDVIRFLKHGEPSRKVGKHLNQKETVMSRKQEMAKLANEIESIKRTLKADMSKKANWWNTTIVFDHGTDFRLHIGAEQSFSSGSSSLNYILSNSMPRVKRETYEPILELLSNNPDIGLYKPSSFDELHMDGKRKSVILGWSLSGVKPQSMDLASYLKSNGIKGYIVKG